MENKKIELERNFLITLKNLSMQCLLENSLKSNNFPPDFDVVKAMSALERIIDDEIDYLDNNPEDYLEIYD